MGGHSKEGNLSLSSGEVTPVNNERCFSKTQQSKWRGRNYKRNNIV